VVVVDGEGVLGDQRAVRVRRDFVSVRIRRRLHLDEPGERHLRRINRSIWLQRSE
jgi:hypothetical protein